MIEVVSNVEKKTVKEKIYQFFEEIIGELATRAEADYITSKKQYFIDWLYYNRLDYFLDCKRLKNNFEWKVFQDIVGMLKLFDSYVEQIEDHDPRMLALKERNNQRLKDLLHEEYDNVNY